MRVGEEVMRELRRLDPVAYVRFASVYEIFRTSANLLTKYRNSIAQTLSRMLASDPIFLQACVELAAKGQMTVRRIHP